MGSKFDFITNTNSLYSMGSDITSTRSYSIEKFNPENHNIKSVLNSELIIPKNNQSQKVYKNKVYNFFKKEGISNIFLYQNKCGHFYRVKNNSEYHKFKTNSSAMTSEASFKPYIKEDCRVCKKHSETPHVAISMEEFVRLWDANTSQGLYNPITFSSVAGELIGQYTKHFRSRRDYYDYKLYDCEISFYKWLYNDTYE